MTKRFLSIALALCLALASVAVSFAKDVECTVTSVAGNTVTLDCGSDAGELKAGSTVKVKAGKAGAKKQAIEGC